MSANSDTIQRIKEQYAAWQHALFWLGIFVNFLVFYLVISNLSYVGLAMPVIQGLYLAMCFKAYAKGFNPLMIIIPLYVVSGALYMSLSSVM
jgi:di/tricarboxylate transporter